MAKGKMEIDHLFEVIRSLTLRPVEIEGSDPNRPRKRPALEDLIARARRLLAAEASSSSTIDGYSAMTPGNGNPGAGKGGGRTMKILDEEGDPDWVPTTSTEAAMFSRVDTRPSERDIAKDATVKVLRDLAMIAEHLQRLESSLGRFERLRDTGELADAPQCHVATMYGLPWDVAWEPWRSTDFARVIDRPFDEPRPVCQFVYKFTYNNPTLRRLPTKEEMLRHLERGTVRLKAS